MRSPPSRRAYLAAVGTAAVAGMAGCVGGESTETSDGTSNDGRIPLVTGADAPFEPFVVGERPAELTGFDVEMLETVIDNMPKYTHEEWVAIDEWPDDFIETINSEDVDVATGAVTILDRREREWGVRFTNPYFVINQAFFVQEGGEFQPASPEDLAGRTIGAKQGTTGLGVVEGFVEDGIIREEQLQTYPEIEEDVMRRVANGELDVGVIDHPVVESRTGDYDIEIAFQVETGEEYGFVVDQGRDDLLSALNAGIEAVRNNDALFGGLVAEWF